MLTSPCGACDRDPLAEAHKEVVAILNGLGIPNPSAVVRPAFERVRQRYAGDRPYIPHTDQEEREEQRRLILEGIAAGLSVRMLAEQTGLPKSTVGRLKKEWAI